MGWELAVVENAGEIPHEQVTEHIAVPTEPLLIDIKSQLMIAKPKTLVYTVGWRALVWQNKETGQFKDITDEQLAEYLATGTVNESEGLKQIAGQDEVASGSEGTDTV